MFSCSGIFNAIRDSKAKIIILQGGTASGKTVSALQEAIVYACHTPGKVVTVTGESIPNLRKGAYRDTEWLHSISPYFQKCVKFWNRSDRIIYLKNGSMIEFISNIDEQSAKAGKRDRLIVDEANGVNWLIFFQMAIRTRDKVVLTYNPSAPFWAHDKLIGTVGENNDLSAIVQTFYSDHRHNPFLTEDEHRKIEGIKDKELWRVYARGLTGNLQGLIYTNWKQIPDEQFPEDAKFIGGLDFGYTNDPTAGVKIAIVGESLFIHEICYTPGITPNNLKSLFEANGFTDNNVIYCDHDPDIIAQLRRLQVQALPSKKGQGSIRAGIFKLYDYNVFYTASSTNIAEERKRYMWKIDKDSGKPTNTPEDGFDHLMDAIRYGVYTHFFK